MLFQVGYLYRLTFRKNQLYVRLLHADTLLRQRLDTVARRYLRDLRRNAYVDVRV